MEKRVRHSLLLVLALLAIALFGVSAFAYETKDDDGDRSKQDDVSMHAVYCNQGMLRFNDDGTTVTLSADKKSVEVTGKTSSSKSWVKTTGLAFVEQTASDADKDAAPQIEFVSEEADGEKISRVLRFSIPVEEVGKRIPVCRKVTEEGVANWSDFTQQAYYTVLITESLYQDIAAAIETADDETKPLLQKALDNAAVQVSCNVKMFSPKETGALVEKADGGWIYKFEYSKTDTFVKVFPGYVSQVPEDEAGAIDIVEGKADIPVSELNTVIPLAFKSKKNGTYYNRAITVDKANKTVVFDPIDDIADVTAARENAIKDLKDKFSPSAYSGDEKAAIEKIHADTEKEINAALTVDNVKEIQASADEAAAKIKTDATKKAEKDAAAKEAAAKEAAAKDAAAKEAAAKDAEDKKAFEAVKTSAKKPKAAKKSFTAKWSVVKGAEGYEVKYGLNKKVSKKAKTKVVKKAAAKSVKIKGLKTKKTYYVKVRAYKTINKVKVYSKWSAVKKVKTK